MSKVFVNVAMSLDGYMAPEGMILENWESPGFKNWGANWGALMAWVLPLERPRQRLARAHDGAHWRQHHGQADVRRR